MGGLIPSSVEPFFYGRETQLPLGHDTKNVSIPREARVMFSKGTNQTGHMVAYDWSGKSLFIVKVICCRTTLTEGTRLWLECD